MDQSTDITKLEEEALSTLQSMQETKEAAITLASLFYAEQPDLVQEATKVLISNTQNQLPNTDQQLAPAIPIPLQPSSESKALLTSPKSTYAVAYPELKYNSQLYQKIFLTSLKTNS